MTKNTCSTTFPQLVQNMWVPMLNRRGGQKQTLNPHPPQHYNLSAYEQNTNMLKCHGPPKQATRLQSLYTNRDGFRISQNIVSLFTKDSRIYTIKMYNKQTSCNKSWSHRPR
ncbi:hypothetical protein Hanom_Chr17g01582641 [Helianthus anomalus]